MRSGSAPTTWVGNVKPSASFCSTSSPCTTTVFAASGRLAAAPTAPPSARPPESATTASGCGSLLNSSSMRWAEPTVTAKNVTIAAARSSGIATDADRCGTRRTSAAASFHCAPPKRLATEPKIRPSAGTTTGPSTPNRPNTAVMPENRTRKIAAIDGPVITASPAITAATATTPMPNLRRLRTTDWSGVWPSDVRSAASGEMRAAARAGRTAANELSVAAVTTPITS